MIRSFFKLPLLNLFVFILKGISSKKMLLNPTSIRARRGVKWFWHNFVVQKKIQMKKYY